jgi:hypothetical protein
MRRIIPIVLVALLPAFPLIAQAAPKESVTLEIDAELLRKAQALHIDLSAMLEEQLASALGGGGAPAPVPDASNAHQAVVTAAFDTFEVIMFAPLKVDDTTSLEDAKKVCVSMFESIDELVDLGAKRKAMALPTTLEEAKALDEYLAGRFQALQARMNENGARLQPAIQRLQNDCPELDRDEAIMANAVNTALGKYGPEGWCQVMRNKPQAEWSMENSEKFVLYCTGAQ